jgi:uncharacterized RDD family membrane protein YckC
MGCPQCQSTEIGSSGKCGVCGYQIQAPDSAPALEAEAKDSRKLTGMIEMIYSEGDHESPPQEDIPQWRKDVSQRFQAIKQKKDAAEVAEKKAYADYKPSPPSDFPIKPAVVAVPPAAKPAEKAPARKPAPRLSVPVPHQKILQPVVSETIASKPALHPADPQEIQKLIDSVVSLQSSAVDQPAGPAENYEVTHEQVVRGRMVRGRTVRGRMVRGRTVRGRMVRGRMVEDEGKWILLSRTLSGLIDLICIVLFTAIFVLAAEFFSGFIMVDFISLLNLSALLLLTYFVYSFFFLFASNQTIGMMITDLRVVGTNKKRPSLTQLVIRCCCYIISLSIFGIGLLWCLFNRGNLCLHDRLSDTTVVRI